MTIVRPFHLLIIDKLYFIIYILKILSVFQKQKGGRKLKMATSFHFQKHEILKTALRKKHLTTITFPPQNTSCFQSQLPYLDKQHSSLIPTSNHLLFCTESTFYVCKKSPHHLFLFPLSLLLSSPDMLDLPTTHNLCEILQKS